MGSKVKIADIFSQENLSVGGNVGRRFAVKDLLIFMYNRCSTGLWRFTLLDILSVLANCCSQHTSYVCSFDVTRPRIHDPSYAVTPAARNTTHSASFILPWIAVQCFGSMLYLCRHFASYGTAQKMLRRCNRPEIRLLYSTILDYMYSACRRK